MLGTQPDGSVSGETSQVMAGVQWLADQGCKVINMSLGGGDKSQAEDALYNQITQDGTLIVVASGNDSAKQLSFPGRYQTVLSVGAVDSSNRLASFSNTGAQLDLVGPGVDNLSSFPQGQGRDAVSLSGTSTLSGAADGVRGRHDRSRHQRSARQLRSGCDSRGLRDACPRLRALIQRGSVSFAQKVASAQAAGAAAAICLQQRRERPGQL